MGLVGDDEATALADRLQAATDRYESKESYKLFSCILFWNKKIASRLLFFIRRLVNEISIISSLAKRSSENVKIQGISRLLKTIYDH